MSRKATPTPHQRSLLKEIKSSRFFRVKHGYRGTGTRLIKIATARELRALGLARVAFAKTNRGSYPCLQLTGYGQDVLDNRDQGKLL